MKFIYFRTCHDGGGGLSNCGFRRFSRVIIFNEMAVSELGNVIATGFSSTDLVSIDFLNNANFRGPWNSATALFINVIKSVYMWKWVVIAKAVPFVVIFFSKSCRHFRNNMLRDLSDTTHPHSSSSPSQRQIFGQHNTRSARLQKIKQQQRNCINLTIRALTDRIAFSAQVRNVVWKRSLQDLQVLLLSINNVQIDDDWFIRFGSQYVSFWHRSI